MSFSAVIPDAMKGVYLVLTDFSLTNQTIYRISGVYILGNRQCEIRETSVPEPGHGQVLVQTRASALCGSDLRSIYRPKVHKTGAEGYLGVIAGHEPCGIIVKRGEGVLDVLVYSIKSVG